MVGKPGVAMKRAVVISISCLIAVCCSGCLSYSHYKYSCRAAAARGEGHFLDLLWGGFPGADAPSIGTDKTVYSKLQ